MDAKKQLTSSYRTDIQKQFRKHPELLNTSAQEYKNGNTAVVEDLKEGYVKNNIQVFEAMHHSKRSLCEDVIKQVLTEIIEAEIEVGSKKQRMDQLK